MQTTKQEEKKIISNWQRNPLEFVCEVWKLKPQKKGQIFEKDKHITWQQVEILEAVGRAIRGEDKKRISIRSGHGIGKSATLSWLLLWYLYCFPDSQVPCTAPTSDQMFDVLWKEASKWWQKMPDLMKAKYDFSSDHIRFKESPETWFARAKTARKENPEALAGVHGDFVMFLVDEASGVPDEIFATGEGALTNKNIIYVMISNPTRLIGYFYDSHNRDKDAWQALHFNSEESPIVDRSFVDRIIQKHGLDSDEYRVRVRGEFPKADAVDTKGYVPLLVQSDIHIAVTDKLIGSLRMGIDPSGEGDDETIWVVRDRFRAIVAASQKLSNPKSIAQMTLSLMSLFGVNPEDVWIDNFGIGANVAQELAFAGTQQKPIRVNGVNVGEKAQDSERFLNLRAEGSWRMREWCKQGGELVRDDGTLETQLLCLRYRPELNGKLRIMSKEDMRHEGLGSPDRADALMLTFVEEELEPGSQGRSYSVTNFPKKLV